MHKYDYHRDQLPSVFSSYFEENTLIHHHNTRQKHFFCIYWIWKKDHQI